MATVAVLKKIMAGQTWDRLPLFRRIRMEVYKSTN